MESMRRVILTAAGAAAVMLFAWGCGKGSKPAGPPPPAPPAPTAAGGASQVAEDVSRSRQVTPPAETPPAASPQRPEIMAQFEAKQPEISKTVEVCGANPAGTLLCFRARQGGTYIYRARTGKVERIDHAKLLLPGQVTRITYKPAAEGRPSTFLLWAREYCVLEIGVGE